jgi:hypothetical protein
MVMAARAMATKVLCNKEGGGNGGKSDGNKGGGWATLTATMWAMATVTRLAGDKESKCKGGKGNGDGNEGRWRWRQRLKPFQRWQQQQQWLWRRQTITETAGAGSNQQNAAGGIGSSGDSSHGSGNHCSAAAMAGRGGVAAEVTTMRAAATVTNTPFCPWKWWEMMREKAGLLTKDGDVELFYVCDFFTLISSVPVICAKGSTI